MATVYISEYPPYPINGLPVPKGPRIAAQTVAITAGSLSSSAFNASTGMVRVHTDAICSIQIDKAPTAVATEGRMAANQTEYFAVSTGDKIAVITNS